MIIRPFLFPEKRKGSPKEKSPEGMVGDCGGFFEDAERVGDFAGHGFKADADFEVAAAPFGLCGPVFVGGDFDLAHGVMFDTVVHCVSLVLVSIISLSKATVENNPLPVTSCSTFR